MEIQEGFFVFLLEIEIEIYADAEPRGRLGNAAVVVVARGGEVGNFGKNVISVGFVEQARVEQGERVVGLQNVVAVEEIAGARMNGELPRRAEIAVNCVFEAEIDFVAQIIENVF